MDYILKRTDIEAMAGLAKIHFLNDNARRNNKSLGDAVGLKNLGIHLIEVQPGYESTEYHVHHFEEECVYVLSGAATVTIGDTDHTVGAGDFVGYPAGGLPHTMRNTGDGVLRCLVIGQRLPHDVGDYPRLGKRIHRHGGMVDVVDHADISHPKVGTRK